MTLKKYISSSPLLFTLIAINLAVAIIVWILSLFDLPLLPLLVIPSDWTLFLSRPWTALTYMFTQASFLHLLFNMLWLLWFGRIFLYISAPRLLLWTYIGGGLTGAIFYVAVCAMGSPLPGSYLIGSSAAVLAVMTSASVMSPNLELRVFLISGVRLKYIALLCILLTFLGIGGGNSGGFSAHFGGVFYGLLAPVAVRDVSPSALVKWIPEKFRRIRLKTKRRRVPDAFLTPASQRKATTDSPENKAVTPLSDEERLDQLLDKVRVSGYSSLSSSEKRELNAISSRL